MSVEQHAGSLSPRSTLALLIFILLIGAVLRLPNITGHNLAMYDEAVYLLVAQDEEARLAWVASGLGLDREGAPSDHPGRFPATPSFFMAKPVYSMAMAFLARFLGWHDWLGHVISAAAGLAAIVIVFVSIIVLTGSRTAAVFSGLYAALSPFLVNYSRLALAESAVMAGELIVLGLALAEMNRAVPRNRLFFAVGLASGLCMLTHYRFLVALVFLSVAIVVMRREVARRALLFLSLGALLVFFFFFTFDLLVWAAAAWSRQRIAHSDLVDQFLLRFQWDRTRFALNGAWIYVDYLLVLENYFLAVVVGAGLLRLIARTAVTSSEKTMLLMFAMHVGYISVTDQVNFPGQKYLRNLTGVMPILVLLFGVWIERISNRYSSHRVVSIFATLLVVATLANLGYYRETALRCSGFRAQFDLCAARFGACWTDMPTLGMVYLGRGRADFPFSPFSPIPDSGIFVAYESELAKYRVDPRGNDTAARARLVVYERIPKSPKSYHLPTLMETGYSLERIRRDYDPGRDPDFVFGHLAPPG